MIEIKINGKKVDVPKGATILDAARTAGERIPTLCHLEDLFPSGACRMCVVEVEGRNGLIPACSYPAEPGMVVHTRSARVLNARKTIVQLLLASHPFECLTCNRNGTCELQDLSVEYNVQSVPFRGETRHHYTDFSSPSIVRDPDKCILCGRCVRVCEEVQGVSAIDFTGRGFDTMVLPAFEMDLSQTDCVNCGQCVLTCPTGALSEVSALDRVIGAVQDKERILVAQVAPAIRVSLGDFFDMPVGANVTGKIASALRQIGFQYVYDTDFSADLTIMEEAHELVQRLQTGGKLPLFTSCCPAWIKFVEQNYPEMMENLSTCKSPQQMMGALVKSYLAKKLDVDPARIFVVSIMPCTAKKYESLRPEMGQNGVPDVDAVLTTREFAALLKQFGMSFPDQEEAEFDAALGLTSGSGDIFAASGGVMEAAVRTAYQVVTGRELENLELHDVRGFEGIKEAQVPINGTTIKVAVVNRLANAREIIRRVQSGEDMYHFVEVMACPGGCVGGGGQMYGYQPDRIRERIQSIYRLDRERKIRVSHKNPAVQDLYREFLGEPGGKKAHHLLHTRYMKKKKRV
jgi:NADH-quinone oxidoreductase subunit G/NADP-reducing hydrogenase subunit HndD